MGEREIKSDNSQFSLPLHRRYPRRFDRVVWRDPGVPISAATWQGGDLRSSLLRVMSRSFVSLIALYSHPISGQISPNAQGHTIPASNTQTHSHTTHSLGEQSTSLRLRLSTPTQRFPRGNAPRRRRAPALQGHQYGAQETFR